MHHQLKSVMQALSLLSYVNEQDKRRATAKNLQRCKGNDSLCGKNMNAITTEQSGRDNRGIQDRDFLAS
jgi:Tfp pilus assembly major pilin PilA